MSILLIFADALSGQVLSYDAALIICWLSVCRKNGIVCYIGINLVHYVEAFDSGFIMKATVDNGKQASICGFCHICISSVFRCWNADLMCVSDSLNKF